MNVWSIKIIHIKNNEIPSLVKLKLVVNDIT